MKEERTNVLRILDKLKIDYVVHSFDVDPENYVGIDEESAPVKVGLPAERVYKTIVTRGKSGEHYVFMLPVNRELDFKKCAAVVGEKNIEPLHLKELLPTTGYIRGGCSPIGMKKKFRTTAYYPVENLPTVVYSAGRPGLMTETKPCDLIRAADVKLGDIVKD
ncbi:MAG TPA: Cys-tRNA(Pro) deacylase [Clostridiales bacterium]|nr:Cys-tRNA(Pro) deacylase [Clostridiales bacterium]